LLFCIFGRVRWGDHQHISKIEWDLDYESFPNCGYVTCSLLRAKTSVTASQLAILGCVYDLLWSSRLSNHGSDLAGNERNSLFRILSWLLVASRCLLL
jgi:hypothetical protein